MMSTEPQPFKYETVESDMRKKVVILGQTDLMHAAIQIVKDGGETNLHTHPGNDGFWFVLSGRARFVGENERLIGEFGKHEGVLIPRGCKYWFESASPEPLEIMRVGAAASPNDLRREDFTPMTESTRAAYEDADRSRQAASTS
jgi:mannose-6-phosphate isomerase-like protein (cupin superfamily)